MGLYSDLLNCKTCNPSPIINMVLGRDRRQWKADYFEKVARLLGQYSRVFICDADNVTSKQFQDIRQGMRGYGDVLMGKNTMMKCAIRKIIGDVPEAVSLAIGYPTVASVPHSIANSFKNLMAIAAATEITFPQAEAMKAFLADPSAFAVAAPAAEDKADDGPAAKEESASDSDSSGGGMNLFGDSDDDF